MLKVSNLNQYYGESHTLWDVSLDIRAGNCTCLMGRNGMGKTTLLKTIMGLLPAESGTIEFEGENIINMAPDRRAHIGIGYVPQGREIFAQLTVEENLQIGLQARNDNKKVIPKRIYELFPVLKDMLKRRGGDLSGGQQQQLAIGRALVIEPKLLILDEPCEGIQPNIVHQIGDVILKLNAEENLTVLLVEQKLPFARRVGKEFVLMNNGRSVANGKMEGLNDKLIKQHLTV
ncbi:MAG: urea ABC transporter ATP-binding subunit UrtE [Gammaproteobacteria bacterium]|jgi:urea transport system ATP-binding protein